MVQNKQITDAGSIGWVPLYEDLASAVGTYADAREQARLFELLAKALDSCAVAFPIMNAGEDLIRIDPFTLFASFNWSYSTEQRAKFVGALSDALGVRVPCSQEHMCKHGYFISERELRFFTFDERTAGREIDLLWSLFSAALLFTKDSADKERILFAQAYDGVLNQRVKGAPLITTALYWIRPSVFLPVNTRVGSFVGTVLGYDPDFFEHTPKAEDYLRFLDDCWAALERRDFGAGITSLAELAAASWQATEPAPPRIDSAKTQELLAQCRTSYAQLHANNTQLWRAVKCFGDNWNENAEDFTAMLKASLAEHGTLLATSNLYNPYWEILRLSQRDPEAVRAAFVTLFDTNIPLCERLIVFEEAIATLYARHRDSMVRAFAKRSSHGNYTAVATYLFLRYPNTSYLYSPLRINALKPRVGYDVTIRIARPESVEQYYDLCNQLLAEVEADKELLALAQSCIKKQDEYTDPAHHLIVEDIISSTLVD